MQEEDKGFTVRDRRIAHEGEAEPEAAERSAPEPDPAPTGPSGAAAASGEAAPSTAGGTEQAARAEAEAGFSLGREAPPIDFSAFVFSLARAALMHLGLEAHPETGRAEVQLEAARETIDVLAMLEEKTRGNLTPEESELIAKMLYTLRMSFVEVSRAGHSG